jgi:hypothetical protein
MVDAITHSSGTLTPTVVDGYSAERETRTIVHPLLGREDDAVTFRPSGLRKGTLPLVFASEADAAEALEVLATPQVLSFLSDDRPTLNMTFVIVSPGASLDLDAQTRNVWLVRAPFKEQNA